MSESLEMRLIDASLLEALEQQAMQVGSETLRAAARNRHLRALVAGSELGQLRRRLEHQQTYSAARGRLNCPSAKQPALQTGPLQVFVPGRVLTLYSESPLTGCAELLKIEAGTTCLATATEHPSLLAISVPDNPALKGFAFARYLKQRFGLAGMIALEAESPLFTQLPCPDDLGDDRISHPVLKQVLLQLLKENPAAPEEWLRDRGDGSVIFRLFKTRYAGPEAHYLRLPKQISWQKFRRQPARFPAWPLLLESALQVELGLDFSLQKNLPTPEKLRYLLTGEASS